MVDSFVGQRTNIDAKHNTMRDYGGLWWTMVDYFRKNGFFFYKIVIDRDKTTSLLISRGYD